MKGVVVHSIQALDDLKASLNRFAAKSQEILQAAEQEIQRIEEWLQERLNYQRYEVQRWQEELQQAEVALRRCLESEENSDCSDYKEAVLYARTHLREAQAELYIVQKWIYLIRQTAEEYERQAQRLKVWIDEELPKAVVFLDNKIANLYSYVTIGMPAGAETAYATIGQATAEATGWNLAGSDMDREVLERALTRLQESKTGRAIASTIYKHRTKVRFGETGDAIACFDPTKNEISINESLRSASPNVLAAHLAHEGIHLQWNRPDSIEQEYYAFKAEAEVWSELKGDEIDEICDNIYAIISLGKEQAKRNIRARYEELPEYA